MVIFLGLNEIIHINSLEQCIASSKPSINLAVAIITWIFKKRIHPQGQLRINVPAI